MKVHRYCLIHNKDSDTRHILIDHNSHAEVSPPVSSFSYTGDTSSFMYEAISIQGDEYLLLDYPNNNISNRAYLTLEKWLDDNDVDEYQFCGWG